MFLGDLRRTCVLSAGAVMELAKICLLIEIGFIFLLVSLLTAGHFYVSGFID